MIVSEFIAKLGFEVEEGGLERMQERIEGIHRTLTLFVSSAIIEKLYELAEGFSGAGVALEKASLAAGVTAEQMQRLQYAASQSSIGTEELSRYLAFLGRSLYQAQSGSKQAIATFAQLGISEAQVKGFKSSADALYAVQDAIGTSALSSAQKLGLVQRLFGRGAYGFLKFAQAGSAATKRLGDDFAKMGGVVDNEGIEQLERMEEKVTSLKMVLRGFLMTVSAQVAPAVIEAITRIQRSWVQNSAAIKTGIGKFVESVTFYAGVIFEALRLVTSAALRFIREHPQLTSIGIKFYVGAALVASACELIANAIGRARAAISFWRVASVRSMRFVGAVLWWLQYSFAVAMERVIAFVGLFSPAAAAALRAWATQLTLLSANAFFVQVSLAAAAIAGIVLAVQALYAQLFQGKSFDETWLGQFINGASKLGRAGLGKVLGFLGFGDKSQNATGALPATTMQQVQANVQQLATGASNMLDTAAGMGIAAPSGDPSAMLMPVGAPSPTINANIQVNVPEGYTPKQAAQAVKQGVTEGLQEHLNNAHRAFAPIAAS